jgi:peptidoglycan hydrolase-like protein with peptidoglycan-binding domain
MEDVRNDVAALLNERPGEYYDGPYPTLPKRGYFQQGDKGVEVGKLQKYLNWFGNYRLAVDGDLGPKSVTAVKAFQKAVGITVDGLFGGVSLAAAKNYCKK